MTALQIILPPTYHKKRGVCKMRNPNNSLLEKMKAASDLFWKMEKKHGRYFIEELYEHKQMIVDTFATMSTWELRELVRYPDYYFASLVRFELSEREAEAVEGGNKRECI